MIVERSPFTVEIDAINSFSVDLLPSTMVKSDVDALATCLCGVDQGPKSVCGRFVLLSWSGLSNAFVSISEYTADREECN